MPDRLEEYLGTVRDQVRWKRARDGVTQELRTHLLDQRDAYLEQGMDEEAAIKESVRQMGDPVEVGVALDRVHRPKPQWGLMALVGVLLCMGYGAQLLLREVTAISDPLLSVDFYDSRWIVFAVVGIVIMFVVYLMDFTLLGKHPMGCFVLGILFLTVVLFTSRKVAGRPFEIQYCLLLAPVMLALLLYGLRGNGWKGLLVDVGATLALTVLALSIPNVTLAMLICCTGFVLLIISVKRGWMGLSVKKGLAVLAGLVGMAVLILGFLAMQSIYFRRRFWFALHPELDPMGRGYHAMVIRSLLDSAKWIGRGEVTVPGYNPIERHLPNIQTDSLLTWLIHRLGWAVGIVVIASFALLLVWMARKALRQRGMLGCLISVAVVSTFAIQVFTYVLFNLGFCLTGTLPLPFVSYGNAFMVVHMALIGLALSVFREELLPVQNDKVQKRKQMPLSQLIFWKDGDLVIGFSRLRQVR